MDRLTEMEAFVQVVDHGGFTDAARKMGLSKSAVSKHVSALEARLAVRLLNRTTRRVSPTEVGLAYYDRARLVLTGAAEADSMVTAMQATPKGSLRVSAPVNFGISQVSPAVARFLCAYPEVDINMVLDDRFVELVAEGFDVAIRIGTLADSSLKASKLADRPRRPRRLARLPRGDGHAADASTTSASTACCTIPSSRPATSGGCAAPPARSARSASAAG